MARIILTTIDELIADLYEAIEDGAKQYLDEIVHALNSRDPNTLLRTLQNQSIRCEWRVNEICAINSLIREAGRRMQNLIRPKSTDFPWTPSPMGAQTKLFS